MKKIFILLLFFGISFSKISVECSLGKNFYGKCEIFGECLKGYVIIYNGKYVEERFFDESNRKIEFIPVGDVKLEAVCLIPFDYYATYIKSQGLLISDVFGKSSVQLVKPLTCYEIRSTYENRVPGIEIRYYNSDKCEENKIIVKQFLKTATYSFISTSCFCPKNPFLLLIGNRKSEVKELSMEGEVIVIRKGWNIIYSTKNNFDISNYARACNLKILKTKDSKGYAVTFENGKLIAKSELEKDKAYIIKAGKDCIIPLEKSSKESKNINFEKGWNLIPYYIDEEIIKKECNPKYFKGDGKNSFGEGYFITYFGSKYFIITEKMFNGNGYFVYCNK
jgi:hypothetical protein